MAANILDARQGGPLPLPHTRLARAAATMPAVHELLPRFRCLEGGLDVRRLSAVDVADLGGDKDLAAASEDFFSSLYAHELPRQRPVVGIRQDTVQSLRLVDGVVHAWEYCFRTDGDGEVKRDANGAPLRYRVWGDGTVRRGSASLLRRTIPVFAQHGALAQGRESRRIVADFLLEDDHLGLDQAEDGIGLNVPDYATPGTAWACRTRRGRHAGLTSRAAQDTGADGRPGRHGGDARRTDRSSTSRAGGIDGLADRQSHKWGEPPVTQDAHEVEPP